MHDITILGEKKNGKEGAPIMTIKAKNGETGEEQVAKISISHDGEYATAVCLAVEDVEARIADGPTRESGGTG
jgi:holo-[acyl-carrier protein] synthase